MEEAQAKYELMLILNSNLIKEDIEKELGNVKSQLVKEGKVFDQDDWGIRDLAGRIGTHDSGYYFIYYFEFLPVHINELNNSLRLNQNVLRHLITLLPENYEIKKGLSEEEESEKKIESTQSPTPKRYEKKPVKDEAAKEEPAAVKAEEPAEAKKEKAAASSAAASGADEKSEKSGKSGKTDKKGGDLKDVDEILNNIMNDITL